MVVVWPYGDPELGTIGSTRGFRGFRSWRLRPGLDFGALETQIFVWALQDFKGD